MSNPLVLISQMKESDEIIWPVASTQTATPGGTSTFIFPQINGPFRVLAAVLLDDTGAATNVGAQGELLRNSNSIGPYQVTIPLILNDTTLVGYQTPVGFTPSVLGSNLPASLACTLVLYFAFPKSCLNG